MLGVQVGTNTGGYSASTGAYAYAIMMVQDIQVVLVQEQVIVLMISLWLLMTQVQMEKFGSVKTEVGSGKVCRN